MLYFAQILPSGLEGPLCLDYADQSALLGTVWFVMLLISLILAVGFFMLRKTKLGLLFTLYFAVLLIARLLNPADKCSHGGLFKASNLGLIIFGVIGLLIFSSFIFGVVNYLKSKKHNTSK